MPIQSKEEVLEKLQLLQAEFSLVLAKRVESLFQTVLALHAECGSNRESSCEPIATNTLQQLQAQAHKLAGSAGTFGHARISELAKHLDRRSLEILKSDEPVLCAEDLAIFTGIITDIKDEHSKVLITPLVSAVAGLESAAPIETGHIRKLIIVDDDQSLTQFLSLQLSQFHFDVHCLDDPRKLGAVLGELNPDIVIMDIAFPGSDDLGFETIEQLRRDQCLRCPVVFSSARSDLQARLGAAKANADGYLVKPVNAIDVVSLLDNLTHDKLRRYRVMLVDDDATLNSFNGLLLEDAGFDVHAVDDPLRATNELERFKPDVILLNIDMPCCSGLDLAKVIRQSPANVQIPIVFLTALSDVKYKADALFSGGDDFLEKPVPPQELIAVLRARAQRARGIINLQQQLVSSEARFRAFSDMAGSALAVSDNQERIIYWNRAAIELFGYTNRDIIGKPISTLIPVGMKDTHNRAFSRVLKDSSVNLRSQLTAMGLTKTGDEIPLDISLSSWEFQGKVYVSAILIDISHRLKAERQLRLSEQVFHASTDYTAILSANYLFQQVNPSYASLFEFSTTEFVGKSAAEVFGRDAFEERIKPGFDRCMSGEKVQFQGWFEFPSRRLFLSTVFLPWFDESQQEVIGVIVIAHDQTDIETAKEDLNQAKDFAEKASRAKSEFLSAMSHELRTPLNAILGFGQMLNLNAKEPLTPAQNRCVEHIMSGGQHLLELINDILDLTKIEAGKVDLFLENMTVNRAIEECMALVESQSEERNIQFTTNVDSDEHVLIRVDHTRLKQILLNLLSNAAKYNREGGEVTVDCKETPTSMLRISVSDTGVGIAEDKYQKIFQPFSRLGAEASGVEGAGIGLLVTKQLVTLMGGHIGFESEVNKGSTFWVDFPVVASSEIAVEGRALTVSGKAITDTDTVTATVLYVDDNPANMDLMHMIVSRIDGLGLISAHTPELGIDLARRRQPDMVILDINLPGMNGIETLDQLLHSTEAGKLPVIALSGSSSQHDIEQGLAAGFQGYLSKPLDVEKVAGLIETILDQDQHAEWSGRW